MNGKLMRQIVFLLTLLLMGVLLTACQSSEARIAAAIEQTRTAEGAYRDMVQQAIRETEQARPSTPTPLPSTPVPPEEEFTPTATDEPSEPTETMETEPTLVTSYVLEDRWQFIYASFDNELFLASLHDYERTTLAAEINIGSKQLFWGVSPDGRMLIYPKNDNVTGILLNMETGDSYLLPGRPYYYAWSPDSSRLLIRYDPGTPEEGKPYELALIDTYNGEVISTIEGASFWDFTFLPDNRLVVSDFYTIYIHEPVLDSNGFLTGFRGASERLNPLRGSFTINLVEASPDGAKIAFLTTKDLYVMNLDGSNVINLTKGELTKDDARMLEDEFSWSPDSTRIAFWTLRKYDTTESGSSLDNPQVWVALADGSSLIEITDDQVWYGRSPSWSPDGSRLLFVAGSNWFYDRYMVLCNPDGSDKYILPEYSWIDNAVFRPAVRVP